MLHAHCAAPCRPSPLHGLRSSCVKGRACLLSMRSILHPDNAATYQQGFQVAADRFPWAHAAELPWQAGVVYKSARAQSGETAAAAAEGKKFKDKKPWHSTPPWLLRPKKQKKRELLPPGRQGSQVLSQQDVLSSKTGGREAALSTDVAAAAAAADTSLPLAPAPPAATGMVRRQGETWAEYEERVSGTSGQHGTRAEALAVDIVKGRMMFVRTSALQGLNLAFNHADIRGDDIAVSAMLAKCRPAHHRVARVFGHGRVLDLPQPHALAANPQHYGRREKVRRRFFEGQG
eukprot:SAG22_NODE_2558_length_2448_cov_1.477224_1_plen_290_part_00